MGDLSLNFSRHEFKCKCGKCDQDTVDYSLIVALESLRAALGAPSIIITSGNRCPEHNKKVGGSPKSQHLKSKAADFRVTGFTPEEVYNELDAMYPYTFGIGLYSSWVHLDVRSDKARWDMT